MRKTFAILVFVTILTLLFAPFAEAKGKKEGLVRKTAGPVIAGAIIGATARGNNGVARGAIAGLAYAVGDLGKPEILRESETHDGRIAPAEQSKASENQIVLVRSVYGANWGVLQVLDESLASKGYRVLDPRYANDRRNYDLLLDVVVTHVGWENSEIRSATEFLREAFGHGRRQKTIAIYRVAVTTTASETGLRIPEKSAVTDVRIVTGINDGWSQYQQINDPQTQAAVMGIEKVFGP